MAELLKKELYKNTDKPIHCSLCRNLVRNALYVYSLDGRTGRFYQCDSCHFMFLHPMMLDTVSSRRMDSLDDAELFNSDLLKTLHRVLIINKEIHRAKKILRKSSFTMLDIGCGTGWTSPI